MTMERKRYRFGSFSWFLLIIALIGVYFIFYDNQTVFFITAGICVFIAGMLWFLARRGLASRQKVLQDELSQYHGSIQNQYQRQQKLVSMDDRYQTSGICEQCGYKMENESSYCSNCGSEI